ncbi:MULTISPECIES: DUF5993 family protein [Streptomyces]|uniref:DUF5993 family protein n=1 Tax=Streptomyces TaxID=1883 RepID=UPI0014774717|nr:MULTISPECIES: DUF5993 family protein [Streptomyces]
MDTLIFAGMFFTWYAMVRERPRGGLVAGWWVLLLAALGLFAFHVGGDLSLGLSF